MLVTIVELCVCTCVEPVISGILVVAWYMYCVDGGWEGSAPIH